MLQPFTLKLYGLSLRHVLGPKEHVVNINIINETLEDLGKAGAVLPVLVLVVSFTEFTLFYGLVTYQFHPHFGKTCASNSGHKTNKHKQKLLVYYLAQNGTRGGCTCTRSCPKT